MNRENSIQLISDKKANLFNYSMQYAFKVVTLNDNFFYLNKTVEKLIKLAILKYFNNNNNSDLLVKLTKNK
jgi:hypothetical protein